MEGFDVGLGDPEDLPPGGDATFHEVDEAGAGLGGYFHIGVDGEQVLIGAGVDGAAGPNDSNAAVAGGGDGAANGRVDDFDDGHVVAFARVPEAGGGCRVAGDDEHFAAAFHEFVSNAEGVFADLGDGEGPVGAVGGVPNVGDGFAGELLHDGAGDGEPTHAGVEDSYWGIIGYFHGVTCVLGKFLVAGFPNSITHYGVAVTSLSARNI